MKEKNNILFSNGMLLLTALVLSLIANCIFHFDGLYGQDSYEYFRYTKSLHTFFTTGTPPGNFFWPLFYPIIGALFSLVIPPAVALQAVSLFSFLLTGKYLHKTIVFLYPNHKNSLLYVLVFFILSPMTFRMSTLIMSDMLTVAFITLCFYHGILYLKKETNPNLIYCTVFGISAIMTRYVAFVILVPLGISILSFLLQQKQKFLQIPKLILIAFLLVIPHLILRTQNSLAFLEHNWLKEWAIVNFFKTTFHTIDGSYHYLLPNIFYGFSNGVDPRYCFAGVMLVFGVFKSKKQLPMRWVLLVSFLLYGIFLAGIPYQNNRFLLLSFPVLLLILFNGFDWLMVTIKENQIRKRIFILVFGMQLLLCSLSLKPIIARNTWEKTMATAMRPFQNKTLYSFDIDIALQGRNLKFDYQNLWVKKYVFFKENSLVLFNPEKFKTGWNGLNPMLNWNTLEEKYQLTIVRDFNDGWKLYQINKK